MEILPLLRILWRRRLLVALGMVAALALGFVAGGGPKATSGVAKARVVLDTPTSQLIQNDPAGAQTLPWRARLIAHLTATEATKARLAARLGIAPDQLAVVDPALATPDAPASLPKAAAEAAATIGAPYVLGVHAEDESLPIVLVEAYAPDRRRAARLAEAGVAVLKNAAPPPEAVANVPPAVAESDAASADPRALQGFVVENVGPVRARTVTANELPVKAIGVPVVTFGLWCACLVLGPLLARFRRRRSVALPA
jgi:hypothetical protein